ncbi:MAG: CocE/NonD family hydrolase [Actinomycetota bacterium]|nr:CocE/NonD family hydrolase [Actinomycetota bacterium]
MPNRSRRRIPATLMAVVVLATILGGTPASAAPNGYVRMSDGTLIAINVRMPDGYRKGGRYPAIFEMSGYDGGSAQGRTLLGEWADEAGYEGEVPLGDDSRQLTWFFNRNYVTVHASARGTGCSGGEFDLFGWRTALDGREIVEWMARQPWSNGDVGIMGHSYGGITGFMVAATRPPSLKAVTVSGLIDDLYRGLVYPGGVSNYGFPVVWTGAIRPFYDVGGGLAPGVVRTQDPVCAQNQSNKRRTVLNDPVVQGLADTDNDWWRARSLTTYAHRINVPIHITGAYQDEQTGPRGPAHLWEMVRGVPKRLLLTNGNHGTNVSPPQVRGDRLRWMDHWVRRADRGFGTRRDPTISVLTLFEMHRRRDGELWANGAKRSRTFPLEDTRWTRFILGAGGMLHDERRPGAIPRGTASYLSGTGRQSWSYHAGPTAGGELSTPEGPDELTFRTPRLKAATAIVGPITARLRMSSTAPDTDVFVQLIDEAPDGSRSYLQRGMLRASHRAITRGLSDHVRWEGRRLLYRPFRPHTNPAEIVPGRYHDYLVEVFPVGHVFRPGHRIVVKVHAPPTVDSFYAYVPRRAPAMNTIKLGGPSHIRLPIVPLAAVRLGGKLPCGAQEAVRCVR